MTDSEINYVKKKYYVVLENNLSGRMKSGMTFTIGNTYKYLFCC